MGVPIHKLKGLGIKPSDVPEKSGRGARYQRAPKERRTADGILFDSIWEMEVYKLLVMKVPAGCLHLQQRMLLLEKQRDILNGVTLPPIHYKCDFLISPRPWSDAEPDLSALVIDAKGHETEIFRRSRKLLLHRYGLSILTVRDSAGEKSKLMKHVEEYVASGKCLR